jgi:LysM repeat protein
LAKIVAGFIGVVILFLLLQSFVLGGGGDGDGSTASVNRPSSIPTATPPAQLPEPVQLGQTGRAGAAGNTTAGAASVRTTYTVQSGDTLGAIASRSNVSPEQQAAWVAEVLRLNNMEDARQLRGGQELILPATPAAAAAGTPARTTTPGVGTAATPAAGTAGQTATPATQATASAPSRGGGGGTYTVESGDIPLTIAAKFCVDNPTSWANQLLELNGASASSLRVGQELTLPAGTPPRC